PGDGRTFTSQGAELEPYDILRTGSNANYYGDLIKDIESAGRSVWTFPYDWRLDLIFNANRLRQSILQLAPRPDETIDVISHSQGGLVVRTYLQLYAMDTRISKIIYLGTPHLGSTKAFAILR